MLNMVPENRRQKPRIAITIRSFTFNEELKKRLEQYFDIVFVNTSGKRLSEPEMITAIQDADAVIAGTEKFTAHVIESSPSLKVISRVGVGTDSIDLDAASRKNIRIMITADSTIQPVAEHTLALLFSIVKHISEYYLSCKSGDTTTARQGSLLAGKTVGIVGFGRIGRRVGELLSGIGCQVLFYDPFVSEPHAQPFEKAESLKDLLIRSDFVSLHMPPQKGDIPLLNREAFNQCRNGIILINTARGSLVDEQALFDALKSGKVTGAGLDVAINEPYSGPLLSFPQVIITPHVASNTLESRNDMEKEAIDNIFKALVKGYT